MTCPHRGKCPAMVSEFTYRKACVEELYGLYCPRDAHTNHKVPREWWILTSAESTKTEEK